MGVILLLLLLSAQTENTRITNSSDIHGYVQIFGGYGTNYKASYDVEKEVTQTVEHEVEYTVDKEVEYAGETTYTPITQAMLDSPTLQGKLAVANVNEIASIVNTSTEAIIARGVYLVNNNFPARRYPLKMSFVDYIVIQGLNRWSKQGFAPSPHAAIKRTPWAEYEISGEDLKYINSLRLIEQTETLTKMIKETKTKMIKETKTEMIKETIEPKPKSNWDFGHNIGIYKSWDYEH